MHRARITGFVSEGGILQTLTRVDLGEVAASDLTVVAELVRAHQGIVTVDSEVGRGTRIVVTLPSA